MLITVNDIEKSFGEQVILGPSSFTVDEKEKIGIVGANGSGKTTLLKLIVGELPSDGGSINISKSAKIGYISQLKAADSDKSLYDEMIEARYDVLELSRRLEELKHKLSSLKGDELNKAIDEYTEAEGSFKDLGGYSYFSEARGILKGLGFLQEDHTKSVSKLSGGEVTRLHLGKLLLGSYDLLILDEPTNHLDMDSIIWLEGYLRDYKGAVILVSHDRYFMDKIVGKVIELDNKRLEIYLGNYTAYADKKAAKRQAYIKAFENQQRNIKHQQEVIDKLRSFNREKSVKRAESRQKMLDKIETIAPPDRESFIRMSLDIKKTSSERVLTAEGLSKAYGNRQIFDGVDLSIRRGEKVALIGKNGIGKTTILKIINGAIDDYKGKITFGENIDIAYFEQNHEGLNNDFSIFDEISTAYPMLGNTEIRNTLALFLFKNDDVFKSIGSLSGGERGRVALAKLMLSGANFIILDEPTNHLDISSKEALEEAVREYEGTVLYVSHDRFFINRTADRIIELTEAATTEYLGNYDYYLEKLSEASSSSIKSVTDKSSEQDTTKTEGYKDWRDAKQREAERRRTANLIKKLEDEIEEYESRLRELDESLQDEEIAGNFVLCAEVSSEQQLIQSRLDEAYEKWDKLNS